MLVSEEDYLMHYGILRKSGRYPWGSGEDQSARNRSFLDTVESMRRQGMSEPDIAKGFEMSTTQLRALKSIASNAERQALIGRVEMMRNVKGMSNVAIGQELGINESSVRSLLEPGARQRADVLMATSDMLKEQVAEKGLIDIGTGVENQLGLSATKLATAVAVLEEQGYTVHTVQVDQLGTNNKTAVKVLAPPGTTYQDVKARRGEIKQIQAFSDDGGSTYVRMQPPLKVDPKRVGIKYKEDGGDLEDGVIHVRPGKDDLSLGGNQYAQVRIAVGDGHYLKGMAVYKDDLPDGVDLVFNTNKKNSGNKLDAMKSIKDDPENPFGSIVRQQIGLDKNGKPYVKSAMNLVNDDDSWESWSKSLSTQVLSKQEPTLAKQQLDMTFERRKNELDTILALTNPAVRRKLLQEFSDGTDSASVHLKAAALPRQKTHVIMPVNSLKETEVYAPNYRNGERVALIRYPHGGKFEIPELTVNNNHPAAKKLLGEQARTAIGINSKVAQKLSGADFDGDTVLVIPNSKGFIKSQPSLAGLKDFDPQARYPAYEGMKPMDARTKGIQMGLVSNLITDMTIRGASPQELARAVRHSMVVIDGEKHNLNYRQSAIDNGISALYKKYQPRDDGRATGGASTLISRAKSPTRIPDAPLRSAARGGAIDRATGRLMYDDPKTYVDRDGRTVVKTREVAKLAATDDARTLSSGTRIEEIYASHSNRLKDLANVARREMVNTENQPYNPSAKAAYRPQVDSLNAKLDTALRNRPRERQAQILANAAVSARIAANPGLEKSEIKKIKSRELAKARARTGAGKEKVDITPDEWDAIQAGAITNHKLEQILANAKPEQVKELATPRTQVVMSTAKTARAKSMAALGYPQSDIADALGVSVSTLQSTLNE